jgi:hypothetical protein
LELAVSEGSLILKHDDDEADAWYRFTGRTEKPLTPARPTAARIKTRIVIVVIGI